MRLGRALKGDAQINKTAQHGSLRRRNRQQAVRIEQFERRDLLSAAPFSSPLTPLGPDRFGVDGAFAVIATSTQGGPAEATIHLEAGTKVSLQAATSISSGLRALVLLDPDEQVVGSTLVATDAPLVLRDLEILETGNYTIQTIIGSQGAVHFSNVVVVTGSSLEGNDTSAQAPRAIDGAQAGDTGLRHWSVVGSADFAFPNEEDSDTYLIDLSAYAGNRISIVLQGIEGNDLRNQTLEFFDPNDDLRGTGEARPNGIMTVQYDTGILNVWVPEGSSGDFKIRVTSSVPGAYMLTVAENLLTGSLDQLQYLVANELTTADSLKELLRGLNTSVDNEQDKSFDRVFDQLTTNELLDALIRANIVQDYGDVVSLRAAVPNLTHMGNDAWRPDGVLTALELVPRTPTEVSGNAAGYEGSLLRDPETDAMRTAREAKDELRQQFADNPEVLLNSLSTERLLQLFDDRISAGSSAADPIQAFVRRPLKGTNLDHVFSTARIDLVGSDVPSDPQTLALTVEEVDDIIDDLLAQPVGKRMIYVPNLLTFSGHFAGHIDATGDWYLIWMDQWAVKVKAAFKKVFGQIQSAIAAHNSTNPPIPLQLDAVLFDFEHDALTHWNLSGSNTAKRLVVPDSTPSPQSIWDALIADPRWDNVKEELIAAGFQNSELTASGLASWGSRDIRESRWNSVMEKLYADNITTAVKGAFGEVSGLGGTELINYDEYFRSHSLPTPAWARIRNSYFTLGDLIGQTQTPVLYGQTGGYDTLNPGAMRNNIPSQIELNISPLPTPKAVLVNSGTVQAPQAAVEFEWESEQDRLVRITLYLEQPLIGVKVDDLLTPEDESDDFRIEDGLKFVVSAFEGRSDAELHTSSLFDDFGPLVEVNEQDKTVTFLAHLRDNESLPATIVPSQVNKNATFYINKPFKGLVNEIQLLRSIAVTSNAPVMPWVSAPQWMHIPHYEEDDGVHASSSGEFDFGHFEQGQSQLVWTGGYWDELIIHASMNGASDFNYWRWSHLDTQANLPQAVAADERFDSVLTEVNTLMGFNDRTTLNRDSLAWDETVFLEDGRLAYVLSGVEVKGYRLWRLTPNPDLAVSGPIVDEQASTISFQFGDPLLGGRTLTFRNVDTNSPTNANSQLGYWIKQTAGDNLLLDDVADLVSVLEAVAPNDVEGSQVRLLAPLHSVRSMPTSILVEAPIDLFEPSCEFTYEFDWNNDSQIDETFVSENTTIEVQHAFATLGVHTFTVTVTPVGGGASYVGTGVVGIAEYMLAEDDNTPGQIDLYYGAGDSSDFIGVGRTDAWTVGLVNIAEHGVNPFPIFAATRNVMIWAGGGNDLVSHLEPALLPLSLVVFGGAGNDSLVGGSSNDMLIGEAGNDTISGGQGDDTLVGGAGDDVLEGNAGNDVYIFDRSSDGENLGHDTLVESTSANDPLDILSLASFSAGVQAVSVNLAASDGIVLEISGKLKITAKATVSGSGNADGIEGVIGTELGDVIFGNDRDNLLFGDEGDDEIAGAAGHDLIIGSLGADSLAGGVGEDLLLAGVVAWGDEGLFTALGAIHAEWRSARSYADRVANISGTGTGARENGNHFLVVGGTVLDDADVDLLAGDDDLDWFLYSFFADLFDNGEPEQGEIETDLG